MVSEPMKHFMILLLAVTTALLSSACYTDSGPPINFILPNGYVGAFRLVHDETNGVDIKEAKNGYTYEIPADGILKVKSLEPFLLFHEVTARYQDGRVLVTETDAGVKDDAIACRSLSSYRKDTPTSKGTTVFTYFIGTKEQAVKFQLSEAFDPY